MLPLAHPHRLEHAIKRGEYADRADLAQQFGITQARETQLLNLTLLAPDIQKAAFKLEAINGVPPTSELVAAVDCSCHRVEGAAAGMGEETPPLRWVEAPVRSALTPFGCTTSYCCRACLSFDRETPANTEDMVLVARGSQ